MTPPPTDDAARRAAALEAAMPLFLRYGYKKTSMDQLARAIGLSRQGLYLWFPNKEALFVEVVDHALHTTSAAVQTVLGGDGPLPDRLVGAFDAYTGQFVGSTSDAMDELLATAKLLAGDRIGQLEADLVARVAQALPPHDGLTAHDRASVLLFASNGLKYRAADRAAYLEGMRLAVRVVLG